MSSTAHLTSDEIRALLEIWRAVGGGNFGPLDFDLRLVERATTSGFLVRMEDEPNVRRWTQAGQLSLASLCIHGRADR